MKRCLRGLVLIVSIAALALSLAGCGGGTPSNSNPTPPPPPPPSSGVTINITCVDHVQVGVVSSNYICTPTVSQGTATLSVDNTSLVTIDSTGKITPNSTGTTGTLKVTATASADTTKTATFNVKVVDWIIYHKAAGGTSDIYVANSDGSGSTLLISKGCYNPEWLNDHLRFACVPNIIQFNQLQIFKTDGTQTGTTLVGTATFPTLDNVSVPSVSPDGSLLLFRARESATNRFGVYTSNTDGTGLKALSQEAPCVGYCNLIGQPRFSHDGKSIVYNHLDSLNRSMVYTMNSDGSNQKKLVDISLVQAGEGAFAVGDQKIFFTEGQGGSPSGTYSINADGTQNSIALVINGYGGVSPSPNGRGLAYATEDGITTRNIDGSNPKQITFFGGFSVGVGHPSW